MGWDRGLFPGSCVSLSNVCHDVCYVNNAISRADMDHLTWPDKERCGIPFLANPHCLCSGSLLVAQCHRAVSCRALARILGPALHDESREYAWQHAWHAAKRSPRKRCWHYEWHGPCARHAAGKFAHKPGAGATAGDTGAIAREFQPTAISSRTHRARKSWGTRQYDHAQPGHDAHVAWWATSGAAPADGAQHAATLREFGRRQPDWTTNGHLGWWFATTFRSSHRCFLCTVAGRLPASDGWWSIASSSRQGSWARTWLGRFASAVDAPGACQCGHDPWPGHWRSRQPAPARPWWPNEPTRTTDARADAAEHAEQPAPAVTATAAAVDPPAAANLAARYSWSPLSAGLLRHGWLAAAQQSACRAWGAGARRIYAAVPEPTAADARLGGMWEWTGWRVAPSCTNWQQKKVHPSAGLN